MSALPVKPDKEGQISIFDSIVIAQLVLRTHQRTTIIKRKTNGTFVYNFIMSLAKIDQNFSENYEK